MTVQNSFVLPKNETLEKRFSFVRDHTLRNNLIVAFKYIIFLIYTCEEKLTPEEIKISICKDIIVYTATIIESCLHYSVKQFIDLGKIDESEIMDVNWKEEKCVDVHIIDDKYKVCGTVKRKEIDKFSKLTSFLIINRAAKRANILNQPLFELAENLRIKRNKIHLAALDTIDISYERTEVDLIFKNAKEIIEKIELSLN